MSFYLECKKMKRTGLVPAFFCGGLLAAAVPVLNMAFRREMYLGLDAPPVQILMDANWQMMSMLNILLVTAGACLMYHTEYADNAIQRICTLPSRESRLFFGKSAFLVLMCAVILAIEAAGTAFCSGHWFPQSAGLWGILLKSFGYAFLLMLPAVFGSLWIASACRNMWISLGIGVVCIFTATMLPAKNFVLSMFPFAMPFQVFAGTAEQTIRNFMAAAVTECLLIAAAEILFLKIRRSLT